MAFTSAGDTETSCGKKTVVPNPFTNRHGITMSSCSKKSVVLSILCILFFPAIIYLGPFLVGPYVYFMWLMERDLKNMYLAEGISTFVGLYSGTMDKHQRLQPHIISHQSVVRSPRWWNVYQEIHSDTIWAISDEHQTDYLAAIPSLCNSILHNRSTWTMDANWMEAPE